MELKDPRPLGETKTTKAQNDTTTTQEIKTVETKNKVKKASSFELPKFKFPTLVFPNIKIPDLRILGIDTSNLPKQKIMYISMIAIPLTLLIILLIIIISYTRAEPYRIANQFMQRIEQRDTKGAYALTTNAYRAVVTEKEFQKIVNTLNSVDISKAKILSKTIDSTRDMGSYAYLTYKVSGYYVEIILYNDRVDWGILSIELSSIK